MTQAPPTQVPDHVEHRVQTPDGRTVAVAEWGDPDGVPVILLGGTPGSRIWWPLDLTLDTRHGIRRLTFDRPGFGESTRRPGRSIVDVVTDVVAIADALSVDRFVIGGASGGGPHALAGAALLPDRVLRCLCIVSGAPYGAERLDWFAGMTEGNVTAFRAALAGEAAIRPILERWSEEQLEKIAAGHANTLPEEFDVPESDLEQMAKRQRIFAASFTTAVAHGVDGWVDDCLALTKPWGFELGGIRVPVRLEYGRDDTLAPVGHGDWLAAHIPGAEVHVLEGGHLDDSLEEDEWAWLAGETE